MEPVPRLSAPLELLGAPAWATPVPIAVDLHERYLRMLSQDRYVDPMVFRAPRL